MKIGVTVSVEGVRGEFVVSAGPNRRGEYEVTRGHLKIWVDAARLTAISLEGSSKRKSKKTATKPKQQLQTYGSGRETIHLDLHGLTVAEAKERLEQTLDSALLEGAACLQILHGLGSGALMRAVHDYLGKSRHIKSFAIAPGNPGLTIAYL